MEGIKLHLVSTGPLKGAGGDGQVTDELLAATQKRVDDVNSFFLESLASGRGLSRDQVDSLATGEVFNANEALSNGLIDQITDFESALLGFSQDVAPQSRTNSAKARISIAKHR
jgi:ClpP class serine protease